MRVTPSQVIIDDPHLVKLFNQKGTLEFLHVCESVLSAMLDIPHVISERNHVLDTLKSDIVSSISNTKFDFSDVINLVKSTSESVLTKVDAFSQLRNTNKYKGAEGEKTLLDILQSAFHPHDGYVVTNTSAVSHSCDIVIQRPGYTDIRIESKAYGCDTGSKVNATEVKKFVSDLVRLNTHGVMVSLYSGISNRDAFEIDVIPSTNKFAFYTSGSDTIVNIIRLIYRLDSITQLNIHGNTTILSNESVSKIREHIFDCHRKSEEIRTNMKNSMRLLTEMSFDSIEKFISCIPPVSENTCHVCQKVFKNKAGVSQHRPSCKGISKTLSLA
jgi:hypothetical protein